MSKICILGTEGTGKTVLLTVLGQKYISPTPNGIFLEPMNREASDFVYKNWKRLTEAHEFPPPTPPGQLSKLDFNLHIGKHMLELNMLDYAGETYREVFGKGEYGEPHQKVLFNHVIESDIILLLINLRDVVNRNNMERGMENFWIPKATLDFIKKQSPGKPVIFVLTQIDRYREILKECGTWKAAIAKYIPHVSGAYSNGPILGVSSVNKITLDEDSNMVPAENFEQEGIDELLRLLASLSKKMAKPVPLGASPLIWAFVLSVLFTLILASTDWKIKSDDGRLILLIGAIIGIPIVSLTGVYIGKTKIGIIVSIILISLLCLFFAALLGFIGGALLGGLISVIAPEDSKVLILLLGGVGAISAFIGIFVYEVYLLKTRFHKIMQKLKGT